LIDMIAARMTRRRATPVMIASAQKVEHYEIASYGTLRRARQAGP